MRIYSNTYSNTGRSISEIDTIDDFYLLTVLAVTLAFL